MATHYIGLAAATSETVSRDTSTVGPVELVVNDASVTREQAVEAIEKIRGWLQTHEFAGTTL